MLAMIAPTRSRTVLTIGVASPRTRITIPPDTINSDPSRKIKLMYSAAALPMLP
jgi:hypothetical protein